jgi:hypothetical protein
MNRHTRLKIGRVRKAFIMNKRVRLSAVLPYGE